MPHYCFNYSKESNHFSWPPAGIGYSNSEGSLQLLYNCVHGSIWDRIPLAQTKTAKSKKKESEVIVSKHFNKYNSKEDRYCSGIGVVYVLLCSVIIALFCVTMTTLFKQFN